MENEDKQISFLQYVDNLYNDTLIKSLIFSSNIRNYISYLELDYIDKSELLEIAYNCLLKNRTSNMFDEKIKANFYTLIRYILEDDNIVSNSDENTIINDIKIILNSLDNNNFSFLKAQVSSRDYGTIYKFNNLKLKQLFKEDIFIIKNIYYQSITDDFAILNMLRINDSLFYNGNYKNYLLNKNFYRSINYFMVKENKLFENSEYLKRVKFIREKDLDILTSGQYEENNVDEEFYDIASVNNRLIKKFK